MKGFSFFNVLLCLSSKAVIIFIDGSLSVSKMKHEFSWIFSPQGRILKQFMFLEAATFRL